MGGDFDRLEHGGEMGGWGDWETGSKSNYYSLSTIHHPPILRLPSGCIQGYDRDTDLKISLKNRHY
jgi:hypothetical protein